MTTFLCLVRFTSPAGETRYRLGHPLIDRYLEFVAGRAPPNTLRDIPPSIVGRSREGCRPIEREMEHSERWSLAVSHLTVSRTVDAGPDQ
jgi:hypothetical protein